MANGTMEHGKKPYFWQRKYFIDRRFQGKFVLRYSFVVAVSAIIVLGALFALKNKAYSLLPDGASVLAQMDVDNHKSLKQDKDGKWQVVPEGEGEEYFPLKVTKGGFRFYNAFDLYLWPVIAVTVLNILIIMIYSVFFSHKVAGPIFKIKKVLNHYLATGEYNDIKLRRGDSLDDLARLINHAMHRHEHRHDNDRRPENGQG
jgi:methyl-accepting chemotaxis protein